jgi:hypothetical protein
MRHNSVQNVDMKRGSLSETIDKGNPCKRTTFARKASASAGADVSAESGTKWAILLNLSTTVSMEERFDYVRGKSVIKSILRCYHGASGTGRGFSNP